MRTRTTVEDPRRDWTVGCLRSRAFDGVFLFGCAALSLASGFGAWYRPEWLIPILAFDILVLSSQHVIATYSRLYFDRLSFRRHRFLTLIAPWIALLWVVGLFMLGGTTLVTTLYLYVQWFHYVGQGYSVERQYAFRVPGVRPQFDLLSAAAVTAIPLFGILHRSLQKRLNPDEVYLTFNFTPLPVTHAVVSASGVLAIVICGAWLFRQIERYTEGKATVPQTLYMIIHWGIFLCGYYLIDDITCGWLVFTVWHNSQYLLMVWLYNNNRFQDRVDPRARWLSYLSRRKTFALWMVVCLVLSGVFYKVVSVLDGWLVKALVSHQDLFSMNPEFFRSSGLLRLNLVPDSTALAAAVAMLSYQVINVHHYMVDAVVWKVGDRVDS